MVPPGKYRSVGDVVVGPEPPRRFQHEGHRHGTRGCWQSQDRSPLRNDKQARGRTRKAPERKDRHQVHVRELLRPPKLLQDRWSPGFVHIHQPEASHYRHPGGSPADHEKHCEQVRPQPLSHRRLGLRECPGPERTPRSVLVFRRCDELRYLWVVRASRGPRWHRPRRQLLPATGRVEGTRSPRRLPIHSGRFSRIQRSRGADGKRPSPAFPSHNAHVQRRESLPLPAETSQGTGGFQGRQHDFGQLLQRVARRHTDRAGSRESYVRAFQFHKGSRIRRVRGTLLEHPWVRNIKECGTTQQI
mmetsp:Transcript_90598/g.184627  ORF Transcript_90598/g.184627 Transcript_90598/m.184627 type:complete len:302 (+) Transcript_90598:500-1405(+)